MLTLGVLAILAADAGISGAGLIAESLLDPNFEQMIRQQMVSPGGISPAEAQVLAELSTVFYVVVGFSWIIIGFLLWMSSRIAEGGLIASVPQIERGQPSSFAHGWMSGRSKMASLIATGLIVLLPTGLLSLGYSIIVSALSLQATQPSFDTTATPDTRAALIWMGFTGTSLLMGLPLTLIRVLADRAIMLDGLPARGAVRRGLAIVRARPGQVVVVGLIEIGGRLLIGMVVGGAAYCALIGLVAAGMATNGPEQGLLVAFLAAVCCLLPPVLVIGGAMESFFATLWSLAWREWTADNPADVLTPNETV